ncbi:hypothetical protein I4F81_002012 [Pyropia yezoensis]|uniref:Uncharacterized protein n=1 Tax=Pyropia yezoensis TaxID=2788 RepID=A0ACC3BPK2_PYRYE|nr:hypothetical protein I4F81_002012 [Neopyropia yezoensis]
MLRLHMYVPREGSVGQLRGRRKRDGERARRAESQRWQGHWRGQATAEGGWAEGAGSSQGVVADQRRGKGRHKERGAVMAKGGVGENVMSPPPPPPPRPASGVPVLPTGTGTLRRGHRVEGPPLPWSVPPHPHPTTAMAGAWGEGSAPATVAAATRGFHGQCQGLGGGGRGGAAGVGNALEAGAHLHSVAHPRVSRRGATRPSPLTPGRGRGGTPCRGWGARECLSRTMGLKLGLGGRGGGGGERPVCARGQ